MGYMLLIAAVVVFFKKNLPREHPWKKHILQLTVALWVHLWRSTKRHFDPKACGKIESIPVKVFGFSFIYIYKVKKVM